VSRAGDLHAHPQRALRRRPDQSELLLQSGVVLPTGGENVPANHLLFVLWSWAFSGSTSVGPSAGRGMLSPLPLRVSLALPSPPTRIVMPSRSSGRPSLSLYLKPFGGIRPICFQHGREPHMLPAGAVILSRRPPAPSNTQSA